MVREASSFAEAEVAAVGDDVAREPVFRPAVELPHAASVIVMPIPAAIARV